MAIKDFFPQALRIERACLSVHMHDLLSNWGLEVVMEREAMSKTSNVRILR